MDYPPPQEINTLYSQVRYIEESDFPPKYKSYMIDGLLNVEMPEYVREFAYKNNCFFVVQDTLWLMHLLRDNNDNIYSCIKNGKSQYINEHNKKLRFYKWYERNKFPKIQFI